DGVVFVAPGSVRAYTGCVFRAAAGPRSVRQALAGIVRVPALYGVAVAAVCLAGGIRLPLAVMRPIGLLSDAALPMMMLVLGMQLERAAIPERPGVVAAAVALSLLVGPIVALGFAALLGVTGAARQAGVVLASMPV